MIESKLDSFEQAAQDLGAPLSERQIEQLGVYAALLRKWNKQFNLISRQDIDRLEERHLLDSLAAFPFLRGDICLDIGSGAGLPGIVLAIAKPELQFVLCERMARRCRFLHTVREALELTNVEICSEDVDALKDREFTTISARAVARPEQIWAWAAPVLARDGVVIVFASTQEDASQPDLDYDISARVSYHRYHLAGIRQTHTLMQMEHL